MRRSIDLRVENGADGGGWPLAWRICQYARLLDGETVGRAVSKMISQAADSFLNGRRIFQIDGNLGAVAGIAEALLQSHTGIIHLLPALPPQWPEGEVKGMCARGSVTVDMAWRDGRLTTARLRPHKDGPLQVRAEGPLTVLEDGTPIQTTQTPYGIQFDARGGKEYCVCSAI